MIDFRELGGGVHVECAGASPSNGLDALAQAGISYQTAIRMPGFLCRIAGKPASDPCVTTSPANAYWTYWIAPRGGSWCYSTLGAGNRTPPPGTVEGWSFAQNKASSALPPPGIAPPRAIPGTTPAPLPASHCATKAPPAPAPTSPPATKAPAAPGAVPSGGSPPSAAGPDGSSPAGQRERTWRQPDRAHHGAGRGRWHSDSTRRESGSRNGRDRTGSDQRTSGRQPARGFGRRR